MPGIIGEGDAADETPDAAGGAAVRRRSRWLLFVAAAVLIAPAAGVLALRLTQSDGSSHAAPAAPPLDLAGVSSEVAGHYRYAAAHEREFSEIPCFCGCEKFLAHRSLYDCFVRADGAGWDAHAAGCAICTGEAAMVARLLERGRSLAEVRSAVVEQFGATVMTAPASS